MDPQGAFPSEAEEAVRTAAVSPEVGVAVERPEAEGSRVPAEAAEETADREAAVFRELVEAAEAAAADREVEDSRESVEEVAGGSHARFAWGTPRRGGTTSASNWRRPPLPTRRGGSGRWIS